MMYSQKYCLAAFLNNVKNGHQFHMSEWPPHITLVDVFAVNDLGSTTNTIEHSLKGFEPFDVTVLSDSVLGETSVTLLDRSEQIVKLHTTLIDTIEAIGGVCNMPAFTRTGFLPHITIRQVSQLNEGDTAHISSICLVDMFPGGDWRQRKVIATWHLTFLEAA